MKDPVGIVGLGLLGLAIAKKLLDADFDVVGFDPDAKAVSKFGQSNGRAVDGPITVFELCDRVIFCLPNSDISRNVIIENGESIASRHLVIDTTTGRPNDAVANGQQLAMKGAKYVEANVAASSQQMKDGSAVLFLGGSADAIEQCRSILDVLAAKTYHLGETGSASKMKLVHNLVLGLNRAALAEGINFSASQGLDPALALEILMNSPACSDVMKTKGEKMIKESFEPQAKLSQHRKDVELILEAADSDLQLDLTKTHLEILRECEDQGLGELDNSAICIRGRGKDNKEDN